MMTVEDSADKEESLPVPSNDAAFSTEQEMTTVEEEESVITAEATTESLQAFNSTVTVSESTPSLITCKKAVTVQCTKCGHLNEVSSSLVKDLIRQNFVDHILSSDYECFQYTGVPNRGMLECMFGWMDKLANSVKNWDGTRKLMPGRDNRGRKWYNISGFEGYLLTLVRIRKSFDVKHTALLFNVSASTVSRVFTLWVNILYQCLAPLLKWPEQEVAHYNLPASFNMFPRTRCIVDCTEFSIEKPFMPAAQRAITWSYYKHSNTAKALVTIHPRGTVTLVSKVFVG